MIRLVKKHPIISSALALVLLYSAGVGLVYVNTHYIREKSAEGVINKPETPGSSKYTDSYSENNSAQESNVLGTANQKPNTQYSYKPSECTNTPIPYRTYYRDDPYLYVGETDEYGGTNGSKATCKSAFNGSTYSYTVTYPYDKVVYRGTKTKEPVASTPANTYTYQQVLSIAKNNPNCVTIALASGTGSSAYLVCIQTVLKQYGFYCPLEKVLSGC